MGSSDLRIQQNPSFFFTAFGNKRLHSLPFQVCRTASSPEGTDRYLITLLLSHHHDDDWLARPRTWGSQTFAQAGMHARSLLQVQRASGAGSHFFLCCFSLTCLVQSKTVSKSDRKRKKGRKQSNRFPLSFHRYHCVFVAASKITLPFSFWCLFFCCFSGVLGHFLAHSSTTHKYRWENVVTKTQALWAAFVLHCQCIV